MATKKSSQDIDRDAVALVDVFEVWIEKQKAKPVRAKSGYISEERIG